MIKKIINNITSYSILLTFIALTNINIYSAAIITYEKILQKKSKVSHVAVKKIQKKINPFHNTPENQRALQKAARDGNIQEATRLINAGVDVDCYSNKFKYTLLMWATMLEKEAMVKLLINSGATIDVLKDKFGTTALVHAVQNLSKKIVEILLVAGASFDQPDQFNKKAIDYAQDPSDNVLHSKKVLKKEISAILSDEPKRRENAVKKWIQANQKEKSKINIINREISQKIETSTDLPIDIAQLIAEYNIEYNDIPMSDRFDIFEKSRE